MNHFIFFSFITQSYAASSVPESLVKLDALTAVSPPKLQNCEFHNITVSKSFNNKTYTDVVVTINGRCTGEHNNKSGGGIFYFKITFYVGKLYYYFYALLFIKIGYR